MKKNKINYFELIEFIKNSLTSNSNATIIETLTQLSIDYRLSTVKYLFVIIVMDILKNDFNKSHLEQEDKRIYSPDADDLDLF